MPRRPKSRRSDATFDNAYRITSYDITSEPITEVPENKLPPHLAGEVDRLYFLVLSHPRDTIVELKRLIDRYPDCPKLFNFLGTAYYSIGDFDRADQITKAAYERFPNYLFAKIAYAELCVRAGDLDQIPVIFAGKYDLGLLYPNRRRFHVTEAVGFMGMMGYYYLCKGEIEHARPYHTALKSLAPDEPHAKRLDGVMDKLNMIGLAAATADYAKRLNRLRGKPSLRDRLAGLFAPQHS